MICSFSLLLSILSLFTFASCVSIDLNKSPPPEDNDLQQVERTQAKSSAISHKPASLDHIRKRKSTFVRAKNTNWEKMPKLGKVIKCKHSKTCVHWETLTRAEKHIVRNREYRQKNPKAREREKAQKKELYRSFSEAQKKELSKRTAKHKEKRIASMNEQELLEYNNRRAKWQREFYAKKMQTSTPEQKREFKDKRKNENKRWRERLKSEQAEV